jgi:hypothetical protein
MRRIKSSALIAATLLVSACATPQLPTQHPGIETDIAALNKKIGRSLDAMMIDECGRGSHQLHGTDSLPRSERDMEEIRTAIETLNHTLDCRRQSFSEVLLEREAMVESARQIRPDIFDAADAEGKSDLVRTIPNLTEEIRQTTLTTRQMEKALLRLSSKL